MDSLGLEGQTTLSRMAEKHHSGRVRPYCSLGSDRFVQGRVAELLSHSVAMARLRKSARSRSSDRLENPPQKPLPDPRFRHSGITIQRSLIPRSASLRLKKTGFAL